MLAERAKSSHGKRVHLIGLDAPERQGAESACERRLGDLTAGAFSGLLSSGGRVSFQQSKKPDRFGHELRAVTVNRTPVSDRMIAAVHAVRSGNSRPDWCGGGRRWGRCLYRAELELMDTAIMADSIALRVHRDASNRRTLKMEPGKNGAAQDDAKGLLPSSNKHSTNLTNQVNEGKFYRAVAALLAHMTEQKKAFTYEDADK